MRGSAYLDFGKVGIELLKNTKQKTNCISVHAQHNTAVLPKVYSTHDFTIFMLKYAERFQQHSLAFFTIHTNENPNINSNIMR